MAATPLFGKVCPILGENVIAKHSRVGSSSHGRSLVHRINAITAAATQVIDAAGAGSLSSASPVRWAQLALQGPRSEMEDDIELETNRIPDFTYAAVYDGHAGLSSVTFLKNELLNECFQALQGGTLLQSNNLEIIKTALTQAFVQADKRLLSCLEEQTEAEKDSGSTASVMFLGKEKVVVANIGDSRVVLSRGGKAEDLTADHRPYGSSKVAVAEAKRILAAGGWITNGRVCGIISLTRAFGNISLKTRREEMLQDGLKKKRWTSKFVSKLDLTNEWITAAPDVTSAELYQDTEFIILASDGLWDSMKSKDAVKFVRDQLREHGDTQRACDNLASTALARNGQDNISIIIADFGKIPRQEAHASDGEQDFAAGLKQVLITSAFLLLGICASQLN